MRAGDVLCSHSTQGKFSVKRHQKLMSWRVSESRTRACSEKAVCLSACICWHGCSPDYSYWFTESKYSAQRELLVRGAVLCLFVLNSGFCTSATGRRAVVA